MIQKPIIVSAEGNAWFQRNKAMLKPSLVNENSDRIFRGITEVSRFFKDHSNTDVRVLELGCSNGYRLEKIHKVYKYDCYGLDPSSEAVAYGTKHFRNLKLNIGTADSTKFSDDYFDIVILGFCLYLVDRNELFAVAHEVNRILKMSSFLIIYDFYSKQSVVKDYKHTKNVKTFKFDNSSIFLWHPFYTLMHQEIRDYHAANHPITDSRDNWISYSLIRKNNSL